MKSDNDSRFKWRIQGPDNSAPVSCTPSMVKNIRRKVLSQAVDWKHSWRFLEVALSREVNYLSPENSSMAGMVKRTGVPSMRV